MGRDVFIRKQSNDVYNTVKFTWPMVNATGRVGGTHTICGGRLRDIQDCRENVISQSCPTMCMHLWLAGLQGQVICQKLKPCHFSEKTDRGKGSQVGRICLVFDSEAKHLLLRMQSECVHLFSPTSVADIGMYRKTVNTTKEK